MNTKTFTVKSTETAEVESNDQGRVYASSNCECGNFRYRDSEAPLTVCFQGTTRVFAQGHDARLKGALIVAGASSQPIERRHFEGTGRSTRYTQVRVSIKTGAERTVTWTEPIVREVWTPTTAINAAKDHGFVAQVEAGIRALSAKIGKRAIKAGHKERTEQALAALKATNDEAPEPGTGVAFDDTKADLQGQVKVGRWWYDISTGERGANGGLLYIAKGGDILEAKVGSETR